MAQNYAVQQHRGACSRHTHPRVGLAEDLAALMHIMMAASAELISADSILMKTMAVELYKNYSRYL